MDLDGVLVDTLALEAGLVDAILARHVPSAPTIPPGLFRSVFPLPIPESWRAILTDLGCESSDGLVDALTADLQLARVKSTPKVLPGVPDILEDAEPRLALAVVSNNPADQIASILEATGLARVGTLAVGNDQGFPSKPAPDMYLEASRRLGLLPSQCAAVEDSRLGARSARLAGCFVVGVATGCEDFKSLETSPDVDRTYESFAAPLLRLAPGDVTAKSLHSPNEFVSHMVEHIAWRTGCEINLRWHSDDWEALGATLGAQLSPLLEENGQTRTMGLIDDGSAEITLVRADAGGIVLEGEAEELEWFRGLRVEQLSSGEALEALLRGLAFGARVQITIAIGSVEDPHHTWEAVFRGIGLALRDLSPILARHARASPTCGAENGASAFDQHSSMQMLGLSVTASSSSGASVTRTTAESVCSAQIRLVRGRFETRLATSPSIDMNGLRDLIEGLADAADTSGHVRFEARELSSSHVVAEDVGMTMGAAFNEVALARMADHGIEGFGWGTGLGEHEDNGLKLALSWEGRKFLKLLPVGWNERELKRFRVGTTLTNGLFSEDLDDFLDGFVGGMHASVMVHWPRTEDLDGSWETLFRGLGQALRMALAPNRPRRGLIAGVKATLA